MINHIRGPWNPDLSHFSAIVDVDGKPMRVGMYVAVQTVKNPMADRRFKNNWLMSDYFKAGSKYVVAAWGRPNGAVRVEIHELRSRNYVLAHPVEEVTMALFPTLRQAEPGNVKELMHDEGQDWVYAKMLDMLVQSGKITMDDVVQMLKTIDEAPEE